MSSPISDSGTTLRQVLTVAQMREAEDALVETGISVDELMHRAGEGAAAWIWRMSAGRSVTVLCGPGNNGGDGYVIAESLRRRGSVVSVVSPFEAKQGAASRARQAWQGEVRKSGEGIHGDILVDCLFGYGLSRGLSEDLVSLLHGLARRHRRLVAVDVPSGVESDSGTLLSEVPRYDLTLALGAWKRAHCLMPSRAMMGQGELVDIGIEPVEGSAKLAGQPNFETPAADAHKYTRGLLAVVAGRMPGAAMLASKAAMRAGAGYVKLMSDHSHPDAPASLVVEQTPLDEALADERISTVLLGPGLGRGEIARDKLLCVLEAGRPIVLDADALHLLDPASLEGVDPRQVAVTPHEGELAKLCESFEIDAESKMERAVALANATGMAVLAKGSDTLLASPGTPLVFFPATPSWLATAGTGDVLAGIIASRLAHHGEPLRAATEGALLHGEAARIAGPAFTADDLAEAISRAYAHFL